MRGFRFRSSLKKWPALFSFFFVFSRGFAARVFGLRPTKRSSPSHARENLWYPGYLVLGLHIMIQIHLRWQILIWIISTERTLTLMATRTHLQRHSVPLCLEIRWRNEEAINSTRNRIYSLNVFLLPTSSTSILFTCLWIDLVRLLATTGKDKKSWKTKNQQLGIKTCSWINSQKNTRPERTILKLTFLKTFRVATQLSDEKIQIKRL